MVGIGRGGGGGKYSLLPLMTSSGGHKRAVRILLEFFLVLEN